MVLCTLMAAFFYMCNNGVSAALAQIYGSFPDCSLTAIQMMSMFPGIMTACSAAVQPWLLRTFSRKGLIVSGLLLVGLAALGVQFFHSSLGLLFLWNGMLGVGSGGLAAPVSALLLRDVSGPAQYAANMGLWNASISFGGIVIGVAGSLAAQRFSWPWCYGPNLLALPAAILCAVWLPKTATERTVKAQKTQKPRCFLRPKSLRVVFRAFLFGLLYFIVFPNLTLLLEENGVGSAPLSGIGIGVLMGGGMVMGVLYQRLPKGLCRNGASAAAALLCGGSLLLAVSGQSSLCLLAGVFINGMANSLMVPTLSIRASADGDLCIMLTATAAPALASFLSPFFCNTVMGLLGRTSCSDRFYLAAWWAAALMVLWWLQDRERKNP